MLNWRKGQSQENDEDMVAVVDDAGYEGATYPQSHWNPGDFIDILSEDDDEETSESSDSDSSDEYDSEDGDGFKDWKGKVDLWDTFHNVSIIGVSMEWFYDMTGIPMGLGSITSHSGSLTICLMDLTLAHDAKFAERTSRNAVKWCEVHPGRVERISIPFTWHSLAMLLMRLVGRNRDFERRNRGRPFSGAYLCADAYIGQLKKSKIPVCDIKGVPLEGEEAAWFLEGLRKRNIHNMVGFEED